MISESKFQQVTQFLNEINSKPEHLKRLPEIPRTMLMSALKNLENGSERDINERDINNVIDILGSLKKENSEVSKSSTLTKVQKFIQNSMGRVSSAKLSQALKTAEPQVWLRQGEALLKEERYAEAFDVLVMAKDKGSVQAYALLGQLFEEGRIDEEQMHEFMSKSGNLGVHWLQQEQIQERMKEMNPHHDPQAELSRTIARDLYGEGSHRKDPIAQRKLAQSNLALFLENQKPQFKKAALALLEKAAKQGDVEAKLLLLKLQK